MSPSIYKANFKNEKVGQVKLGVFNTLYGLGGFRMCDPKYIALAL